MDNLKKLLFATAMMAALVGKADAATMMPEYLIGQWCGAQTPDRWLKNSEGGVILEGQYIRAKNFCKETRPMIFDIHRFGFWIKLAYEQAKILCTPQEVELYAHGWSVVADCKAEDDRSTPPVYRMGFTFDSRQQGEVGITRWVPRD
jgi:hypothetical protein